MQRSRVPGHGCQGRAINSKQEEDPKELNKVLLERVLYLDSKIQQLDNHNEKLKGIIKKSLNSDGTISTTPNTTNSLFTASLACVSSG